MLELTRSAAKQVRRAAGDSDSEELALRIAATRKDDGGIDYRMGFDEIRPGDVVVTSRGVDVLVAEADRELLENLTIDFVELNPGDHRFIFLNPADPHYRAPEDTPPQAPGERPGED